MIGRRTFLQIIGLSSVPASKGIPIRPNPPHNSLQQARLNRMPEKVYADYWKKKNERCGGVNHGFTFLEWILAPNGDWPEEVSERDAAVAASIIQWLGTNCGLGFMSECEREIKRVEQLNRKKEK